MIDVGSGAGVFSSLLFQYSVANKVVFYELNVSLRNSISIIINFFRYWFFFPDEINNVELLHDANFAFVRN